MTLNAEVLLIPLPPVPPPFFPRTAPLPALLHILSFRLGFNLRNSEADGSQGNLFMIVAESFSMRLC